MTIVVTSPAVRSRVATALVRIVARAMTSVVTSRAVMSPVATNPVVIVLRVQSVAGVTSPVVTNRVVTSPAATNPAANAVTSVPLVTMVAASVWAWTKSARHRRRPAPWLLRVRCRRPRLLPLAPRLVRLLPKRMTTSV
jgi:hypothetical protein